MKKKYRLLKRENIYDDISSSNIALIFWLVYEFRLEPLFVDSQCYSHISIEQILMRLGMKRLRLIAIKLSINKKRAYQELSRYARYNLTN